MRITKKISAIALSIFMVVSMMPFTVFAEGLPVADVEEINVAGYETAYSFKATDTAETVGASAYKDYITDFVVSFDQDIEAGQIILGGSYEGYNNGEWVEITLPALTAGTPYRLLSEKLGETFTYEDIVTIVKEFKCAAKGLDAAGVTLSIDLNLYETAASTAPITVAEKEYTFTGLPVAIVSDITVDGYEKAYSFKANDTADSIASSSYKDYITDFVISFDKDVAAGAVVLGGSYEGYNNGEWVEITLPALSAGEPYRLLAENLGETFTYEDIVTIVKEFKCAAKGLDAAGATLSVDLNLYETASSTTPITIADKEYTFEDTVSAVPTATVTDITVDGYEKAYSYKADDTAESIAGNSYKDYIADFVVSVDRDVEAGQIVLAGSYEGYNNGEWVEITLPALTAGTPYRLLAENLGETFTYEDIVTIVKEFKCAAKGLNAAGVTLSVDLNLYETAASTAPITIADKEYTFEDAVSAVPTATVTDIFVDGYEKAYCYTADDTAESIAGNSYKDYLADFVVSVDRDVAAGQIILAGSYEGYNNGEWVEIALPALTAGTPYRLLAENLGESFTYEDIVTIVKEFKCAAKGLDAAGVTLSVDLNIYETAASTTPITIADKEYTFANDEFSITVADEIDLNIYVEDTGNIVALEVTNFDLETEDTTHGTVTYSGSELAALLSGNQYKVRVPLAPAQIRDRIQVKVITNDGNTGDGSVGRVITKSVADYCDDILASGMDQNIKDLAQSVLDYGKAASDYFDYNTDLFDGYAIANPTATFGTYNASESSIGISTVEYRATSVPELRFYVSGIDEAAAAAMTVSSNIGEASFAKLPDGTVILQVVGISASKLGQEIVISGDVTLKYTPLKWAKAASTNSNAKLAALANAVANYSAAANAYFD